jgi:CreA protein
MKRSILLAAAALLCGIAAAQTIGSVDTAFKWLGANHKIEVIAFDDPKVQGSTCYLSRPITGGLMGSVGLAEDKSDVGIACRATGPLKVTTQFGPGEQVFDESRSPLFKKLRVVRFWDQPRQVLVYLAYSDKLIDGSPKNSISVVPFR